MTATALEVPATAAGVFGDCLPRVEIYAALLAGPGVERGLLGPREAPRLWERHLLNCAGLAAMVPPGATVLDLGSGAGLPGIVLALQRPDLTVVLVEPLLRRSAFLTEAVEALGLQAVVVRRSRAEDLAGELYADVVVARAVAPIERLVGWALPLLRPGGRLLALKGEQAAGELEMARPALRRWGASSSEVVEVGDVVLGTAARVVVVERSAASRATAASSAGGPSRPGAASAGRRRPR